MASVAMNGDDPAVRDEQAVDQAAAHARPAARMRTMHQERRPCELGRQGRRPHRRQRDDRADRQVDAAADDHERHADADHADRPRRAAGSSACCRSVGERSPAVLTPTTHEDQQGHDQAEVAARPAAGQQPAIGQRPAPRCWSPARPGRCVAGAPAHAGLPSCVAASCSAPSMTRSSTCASLSSVGGASWTTRPSRMTRTRSARPSTSGISLETSTTADAGVGQLADQRRRSPRGRRRRRRGWARRAAARRQPRSSQRASTTFCWLPPDSVRTRRRGSAGARRAARSTSRPRPAPPPGRVKPTRAKRASWPASCCGTTGSPAAAPGSCAPPGPARARRGRRRRPTPGAARLPLTVTWPASALRAPYTVSRISERPGADQAGQADDLARRGR